MGNQTPGQMRRSHCSARSSHPPNLRWVIAGILGFGVLINYIDRGALSVAAKPLHDELGMGPEQFGILSSAFFAVYAFSQIPIGYILDRFGLVIVSRIGALLWSIASALTALAPNFASIYAARLFLGLAEAPTFPANAKAIGYWFPRSERGLATSLFDAAAKRFERLGGGFAAFEQNKDGATASQAIGHIAVVVEEARVALDRGAVRREPPGLLRNFGLEATAADRAGALAR